jgi:hypothetical protein
MKSFRTITRKAVPHKAKRTKARVLMSCSTITGVTQFFTVGKIGVDRKLAVAQGVTTSSIELHTTTGAPRK